MKVSHKDHISIFDDVIDKEICENIIKSFDIYEKRNGSIYKDTYKKSGPISSMRRNDFSIFCTDEVLPEIYDFIDKIVRNCFLEYKKYFFQVESTIIDFREIKLQKTPIRGGFHDWHCEIGDVSSIDRCLVWMIYLNDIPEGEGQTDFLWQGIKVQPKAGRLVMWPAFFTHVHRGNPVYTHEKYVATGWGIYLDPNFDDFYIRDNEGLLHRNLDIE